MVPAIPTRSVREKRSSIPSTSMLMSGLKSNVGVANDTSDRNFADGALNSEVRRA
jgi:hypothetical protein